jgi:hypothetical protein
MPAMQVQNLRNDAFDVERATKKFFANYTKVYLDL